MANENAVELLNSIDVSGLSSEDLAAIDDPKLRAVLQAVIESEDVVTSAGTHFTYSQSLPGQDEPLVQE